MKSDLSEKERNALIVYQFLSAHSLTPSVVEVSLQPQQSIEFEAGQYLSFFIPEKSPGEAEVRRAFFSIASPPSHAQIQLWIKRGPKGSVSDAVSRLAPGQTLQGFAPAGKLVYRPASGRNACFISTGTGIAPLRSIMLSNKFTESHIGQTWIIHGARDEKELHCESELKVRPKTIWIPTLSNPSSTWTGKTGYVTEIVQTLGATFPWKETDFYIGGQREMVSNVIDFLVQKSVAETSIHIER